MNPRLDTDTPAPLLIGISGTVLEADDVALLTDIMPAGIVLFQRNYHDREQLEQLVADVHGVIGKDAIIAIDHEGGRIVRFPGFRPELPSAALLGQTQDPEKVYRLARAAAAALTSWGITLNLAPVLDIASDTTHMCLKDRCFGNDTRLVRDMGCAYIAGMRDGGLACCAKHFPGIGSAAIDTHDGTATIAASRDAIDEQLAPFVAAVAADVACIMVGHCRYPAFGDGEPAVFSSAIVSDLLRCDLAFNGTIITDDLEMGAISNDYPIGTAVSRSLGAGCDLACICKSPELQRQAHMAIAAGRQ